MDADEVERLVVVGDSVVFLVSLAVGVLVFEVVVFWVVGCAAGLVDVFG